MFDGSVRSQKLPKEKAGKQFSEKNENQFVLSTFVKSNRKISKLSSII